MSKCNSLVFVQYLFGVQSGSHSVYTGRDTQLEIVHPSIFLFIQNSITLVIQE